MTSMPFALDKELKWDDPDGWETASEETIVDQRRWVTVWERIITDGNGTYYRLMWETASTETAEGSESDEVKAVRVYPHTVSVVTYKETPA